MPGIGAHQLLTLALTRILVAGLVPFVLFCYHFRSKSPFCHRLCAFIEARFRLEPSTRITRGVERVFWSSACLYCSLVHAYCVLCLSALESYWVRCLTIASPDNFFACPSSHAYKMSLLHDVWPLWSMTSPLSSRSLRGDEYFHQGPSWHTIIAYFLPSFNSTMATHTINTRSKTKSLASQKTEVAHIECLVCTEAKALNHFPLFTLSTECQHEMHVCLDCVRLSIEADLKNKHWQEISCPSCDSRLDARAIELYAGPETRAKYESLLTRHMLESQEGFRWVS